jgi:hypothetical protein
MNHQLISPEYLELQKDLHARYAYGIGADVDEVVKILFNNLPWVGGIKPLGGASILDYGCGRGVLREKLINPNDGEPAVDIREYDPAIPGKDAMPELADAVVCADVLEHVEEDRVPAVIAHIASLTRQFAVFIIATAPSAKIMADGRNAHITLHDLRWWLDQIEARMIVEKSEDRTAEGKGLLIIAKPLPKMQLDGEGFTAIGKIKAICAVDNEARIEQCAVNMRLVKQRVMPDTDLVKLPDNGRHAVLACYGPSLQDSWEDIDWEYGGVDVDVFSCSGSHRFLLERGLVPYAHIECDPRPHKADQLGEPHPDVRYWLASCVSPALVDKLSDAGVMPHTALWHAYNGEDSHAFFTREEPRQRVIVGGGSVGLRGMALLIFMGYRKITIHGMDCSFRDGEQHAGDHSGKRMEQIEVLCSGRKFKTSAALVTYYRYLYKQLALVGDDVELIFKGDGMLQHSLRNPE